MAERSDELYELRMSQRIHCVDLHTHGGVIFRLQRSHHFGGKLQVRVRLVSDAVDLPEATSVW